MAAPLLDASNHYDLPVPRRRHGHPLLPILPSRSGHGKASPPQDRLAVDCFMGINGQMLNSVLQFHGLQFTTVTNSTLITATTPAITSVCAYLLLHEAFSKKQWLGILLSFSGVLAVITKGNFDIIRTMSFNVGDVFCIASQLAWAFYSLASRKLTGHMDVLTALGWCSLCGTAGTAIYGIFSNTLVLSPLPPVPFLSYLYITLFGGIAANVFWNIGVKNVGPSVSSVFLNFTPVMGMVAGYLILQIPSDRSRLSEPV